MDVHFVSWQRNDGGGGALDIPAAAAVHQHFNFHDTQ